MFIDSHSHLTDKRYASVDDVLSDAKAHGVEFLVDVGYDEKSSFGACQNADRYDNVCFSAGLHPSEANRGDLDLQLIKSLLTHKKAVAVGEIGLDYHYEGFDRAKQIELFVSQLEIANEFSLPVVIHSRDASADTLKTLKDNARLLQNGFLMHCYSESLEQAKNYLDLGAYFAFGGVITFKNSKKDEIVRSIPVDRLLAETDCPYMSPEPKRGTVNVPSNVVYVYNKMASILGLDVNVLAEKIETNFKRFFKKATL